MANFTLLRVYIIFVLTFIDLANTGVLPDNNKEKVQVNVPNHSNNSGSPNICLNKTNCNNNKRYVDICIYDHEWSKSGNRMRTKDRCSYKQRSKTTAALISIYLGIFGVDWFYLSRGNIGYIVGGICKLFISCACCSGWPLLTLGTRRLSGIMIMIGYAVSLLFSLTSLAWWVIDWARILANKFPDGNGAELKHFSESF